MTRHYIEIKNDKLQRTTLSNYLTRQTRIKAKIEELAVSSRDGVYRCKIKSWDGVPFIYIGMRCKSAQAEAERLQGNNDKAKRVARTGAPGIGNNQQMAEAATSRLYNLRRETERLIGWLLKDS